MNNIFTKYLENLECVKQSYLEEDTIKQNLLSGDISLYIPQWNYLNKSNIEIISKNHGLVIWGKENSTNIQSGNKLIKISKNIFTVLDEIEDLLKKTNNNFPIFYSGILAYESANFIENIPRAKSFYNLPDYYFIFPGNTLLIDHKKKEICEFKLEDFVSLPFFKDTDNNENINLVINESKPEYLKKIKQVRDLIFSGEVYQINYTIRFSNAIRQTGKEFFKQFYKINPAPFSFYTMIPHCEIISNSPERFLQLEENKVITQPIKGTIKRTDDKELNKELIKQLLHSKKDAAELSMIVDLLRNDISKVCKPGSVKVIKHKELKEFSNVFHLVSTISGNLSNNATFVDLLIAAFPGGSITGCPKIAAMKHISRLEKHERSFYTGSFFLRFPHENSMDSSILIRTAIKMGNTVHFQAGGGIVSDSVPELEYNECLTKVSSFLKAVDELT